MSNDVTLWIGFIAAAYLAGSIPFGLLIGRLRGVDIRKHGSGNIGATNAGRVLGKKYGALCFALDVLKGAAPVLIAGVVMETLEARRMDAATVAWWFAVAIGAIAGHMHPVWLRFKGGKGVATGFGSLLAMWPVTSVAAIGALLVWLASVWFTSLAGISSCLAALCLPAFIAIAAVFLGDPDAPAIARLGDYWPAIVLAGAMAAIVIWRHRGNIRRTIAGTEPKTSLLRAQGE